MGRGKRTNRKVGTKGSKSRSSGMGRDILAVLAIAAALVLGLALITFSASDTPLVARGLPTASNLAGPVGHRIALGFYRTLGFASLVVPIGVGLIAFRLFRVVQLRITFVASIAHVVLALSVATLAHLFLAGRHLASFPPGGGVGRTLCLRAEALFSSVGAGLVVGASAVVALIAATDFKVRATASFLFRAASAITGFLGSRMLESVDQHRQAIAELRARKALDRARRAEAEAESVEAGDSDAEADCPPGAGVAVHRRPPRVKFGDEPAWVHALPGTLEELERSAQKKTPELEPACDATDTKPPPPDPGDPSEPSASDEPPAPKEKPEIVLSQAMLERNNKKKDKKEPPAFAFTKSGEVFRLPSTDLLDQRESVKQEVDTGGLQRIAEVIVATLRQHAVDGAIRHIRPGPVVTLYEFVPVAGVKLAKIENLDKELTMALSATRIRIIAPIPGKGVVGIEVPNRDRAKVYLREVLESEGFATAAGMLPLALGKNIEGMPYCVDLQRMPHLLIAGTTGSGKSVGLNTMILSLLYRQMPDQVRFILVDPKMTELSIYEDIPHLLLPVVTDPAKAARALQWAVDEMERRTQILADTGSKDLRSYNGKAEKLRAEGRSFGDPEPDAAPPRKLIVVDATQGETEEMAAARLANADDASCAAPGEESVAG
ncbi:MAG TPA: DNA translocase FtsK 4TM domain-containing protein, partial [Anaeromyxobacteraceae bacterium]|nr:DNA translocase FtsK 4TM domain-containing protein [Anaeromyxobacteraceae bacterium]